MRTRIAIAVATALIVALATLIVSGPSATMSADGPPIAPVGSTWSYLVDYEDDINGYYEYDHPFDIRMVEHNVMPPPGVCITTPPAVNSFRVQGDTHPDAGCPGCTVPGRYYSSTWLQYQGPFEIYSSMTDLTEQWWVVPGCLNSMIPYTTDVACYDYAGTQPGWPYTAGESWTYTWRDDVWMSGCGSPHYITYTQTVEAVGVTVTVPAGTFTDCVYMKVTGDGVCYRETWWSPTVMSMVKQIRPCWFEGVETWELASYTLVLPPTPTPPPPVGGTIIPTDKTGLVMPWVIAVGLILAAGVSLVVWNRKRGTQRAS